MPKKYPAVLLIARHGRRLAIAVGAVIAIAAVVALLLGQPVAAAAAG